MKVWKKLKISCLQLSVTPQKCWNCPKLPKIARNCTKLDCIKLPKIVQNCAKLPNNFPKFAKFTQNYHKIISLKLHEIELVQFFHQPSNVFNFSEPLRSCIKIRHVIGIRKAHEFTRRYRAFRPRARDCPCTLSGVNNSILASGNASYSGFAWTTVNGHPAEPDIFFRRCTQMCHCHCHYTTLQRLMLSTSSQMYQDRFPFPSV